MNGLRTELSFKLVCSMCGNELEAASKQNYSNQMNSAWKCCAVMKIEPCKTCIEEVSKPSKLIYEAISLLSPGRKIMEDNNGKTKTEQKENGQINKTA